MPKRELKPKDDDLTDLQQAFLEELLLDPTNRAASYARACQRLGHKVPANVKQVAHDSYHKPHMQAHWQAMIRSRQERLQFRADEVLQELRDQLSVDVGQLVSIEPIKERDTDAEPDKSGQYPWKVVGYRLTPAAFDTLTMVQRRAIKSIRLDSNGNFVVELHDRMAILDRVMEHLGMSKPMSVQVNQQFVMVLPQQPAETAEEWQKRFAPPSR